jgi:hypothetical protein
MFVTCEAGVRRFGRWCFQQPKHYSIAMYSKTQKEIKQKEETWTYSMDNESHKTTWKHTAIFLGMFFSGLFGKSP